MFLKFEGARRCSKYVLIKLKAKLGVTLVITACSIDPPYQFYVDALITCKMKTMMLIGTP
jgi:hypothetical protein